MDYSRVTALLGGRADLVIPDLRGFGESDRHQAEPRAGYSAAAQARGILGLLDELGLDRPLIGGYDIGSRVAQAIAQAAPDRIRGIVISPPVPGTGTRILNPSAANEFWYQSFHQLPLAERLIDGNRDATRAYLSHFWSHWSGPNYVQAEADLERLTELYARPGAFTSSIAWYRAGSGAVARSLTETIPDPGDRIQLETAVLWPDADPLFPVDWSDRLDSFFARATLHILRGTGHFVPLEAPDRFASAVVQALR